MTQGIRTHRFVRRNVVLHRDTAGKTQKFHANIVKSQTTSGEHDTPFTDALGAFADDAGWEDFVAAVEAGQQTQNEFEAAKSDAPEDWDRFQETLTLLRQKRSGEQSDNTAVQ